MLKRKLGNKNFNLYKDFFIKKRIFQPWQSFRIIYKQAQKRSIMNGQISISKKQYLIEKYIKLRSLHYPLQYICKQWQFRQLNLLLKPPILIPRFQTEQMLAILFQKEQFLRKVDEISKENRKFKFLQLGCGSGAIGLSLAKYFQLNKIDYFGQMIDIEKKAVQLSMINLKRNRLDYENISIEQKDMIKILDETSQTHFLQQFDLIISNPPYISSIQYNSTLQRQVKKYQSKLALIGDQNVNMTGLFYIEKILNAVKKCNSVKRPMLVLQYGGESLIHLGSQIQKAVVKDYYGKRRFIIIFSSR